MEELGTTSKNSLRGITLGRKPICEIHSLISIISWDRLICELGVCELRFCELQVKKLTTVFHIIIKIKVAHNNEKWIGYFDNHNTHNNVT